MSSVENELENIVQEQEQQEEKKTRIDFKMVTFSLAGRDYGIDIMKVKEISKASNFTIVPNTPPYVEGVHNLRGEIISIINLRKMFHLTFDEKRKEEAVDILILRLEDNIIGMIVDSVDNVVGIDSSTIQPRHPLFADINMKYINGVVEVNKKLYVILDVERVFGMEEESLESKAIVSEAAPPAGTMKKQETVTGAELEFDFIKETLATFKKFYISDLNEDWAHKRLSEWRKIRKTQKKGVQLESIEDAESFLEEFYSTYSNMLWGEEYKKQVEALLKDTKKSALNVWCPNCGKGYDAYAIAAILRLRFPKQRVKVWASDHELLNISAAPNLVLPVQSVPQYFIEAQFVQKTESGYQFVKSIKDIILFEYHDILHGTPLPELDIILARDVLSFYNPALQEKLLEQFHEKITDKGILIIGTHEKLKKAGFIEMKSGNLIAYRNEKD
ncbi:MAG: chemotaxis protein CheW [Spirochaetales bacterium]|nr:chemotaxis protein CheW [Spirochaetales bacterium]